MPHAVATDYTCFPLLLYQSIWTSLHTAYGTIWNNVTLVFPKKGITQIGLWIPVLLILFSPFDFISAVAVTTLCIHLSLPLLTFFRKINSSKPSAHTRSMGCRGNQQLKGKYRFICPVPVTSSWALCLPRCWVRVAQALLLCWYAPLISSQAAFTCRSSVGTVKSHGFFGVKRKKNPFFLCENSISPVYYLHQSPEMPTVFFSSTTFFTEIFLRNLTFAVL